jgi:sporulation protein YlmC with PRC-barrel domain
MMMSVSALALMMGSAHAAGAPDVTEGSPEEITYDEAANAVEDAAEATGDALEATGNAIADAAAAVTNGLKEVDVADTTYVIPEANSYSANDLIGSAVYGSNGEVVARIDDVWINADGDVNAFLVSEGGFLGVGTDDAAMKSTSITFNRDSAGNLSGYVGLSEEQMAEIAEQRYDAKAEYRAEADDYEGLTLEDHVLAKAVVDANGEEVATVRDALISRDGDVTHLVLARGGVLGFGGELTAVRVGTFGFEQGDSEGALVMQTSARELMDMPQFRYAIDVQAEAK